MSLQIILQALHVLYCGPWPWQICAHVGNSLMLSGAGESGHNTAQSIPHNFFEQSGTEQRMWPGDTRPGANKWFLPRQPLKTPFQQPFVMGENKELATEVKIYFGYLLRVQRPASVYLFDTLCPGYWGDDLSCDRQYLGTRSQPGEWRVSASHLGLWAH